MPTVEEAYTKAHQQDCESFWKVVRVLKELETKEKLPFKTTGRFLEMLIEHVLYVDKADAEIWTTILEQYVKAGKEAVAALTKQISRESNVPQDPPRGLKALMLRVPLEVKVSERYNLRQQIEYGETILKAYRKKVKDHSFHGHNIASVQRRMMDTLAPALGNVTKAATYTHRILHAWDPDAAADKDHLRTAYQERKRLARSKTAKAARRSSK